MRLLGIRGASDNDAEDPRLADELIPCRPDDDSFEPRLKAVLRRHVVERCIYAVDLDPLAVELCRLSLWIETMDRTLPFGFLDHKIKCGNALIGAWFDQFAHYPVMAWKNREGGDKNHSNGVHFEKNARTRAIKRFVKETLTPDLRQFLRSADLFQPALLEQTAETHNDALSVLLRMHAMPVHDAAERARAYRDELVGSHAWRALKEAMDVWCACWFWPVDDIDRAPLPTAFAAPPEAAHTVARRLAAEMRFFHWELEFPDVFREAASGFDAMLGNPPWETLQPNSMEFFSNIDPLYRSYGKQEALRRQTEYFADMTVERNWLDYGTKFTNDSNWTKYAASPFGDPQKSGKGQDRFALGRGHENDETHARWREARTRSSGFGDPAHPFAHRGGGKAYTYKLFLESGHALLKPPRPDAAHENTSADTQANDGDTDAQAPAATHTHGGRLGFIVPSGLYSDHGAAALRNLFLEGCRWEWLFGIENRDKIFPIDSRFKFNPIIIEKGETTEAIRTAFMRRNPDDWERADELTITYTLAQIKQFSPKGRALLEIQSRRDLEILEKIYANAVLLGDDGPDGWRVQYAQGDFNMTSDSRLFPPRSQWEAEGYRPDEYSRWLLGDWRPIEELWEEMGVDPSQPQPAEIELEEWLFDTTAGPERRDAEARLLHGHWLKPGDVARTGWRQRCAQPPYDRLPVGRADIPAGVVLSRNGDAWMRQEEVRGVALPLYQGIMIQPFLPSARGWLSGTGLRAQWDYCDLGNLQWNPQYLMAAEESKDRIGLVPGPRIGFRDISRDSDVRSFMGAMLPGFPCGNSAPVLRRDGAATSNADAQPLLLTLLLNSFVFDWQIRRKGGGAHLNWHMLSDLALPAPTATSATTALAAIATRMNFYGPLFAADAFLTATGAESIGALQGGERIRLRAVMDAIAAALYGCGASEFAHILQDVDLSAARLREHSRALDVRGFWRVDRGEEPELRHAVLTLVAFHDLQTKIDAAGSDCERGIKAFLAQNDGEGWILPETLRLADYGLGHDERAGEPQPVASRLGPRFYDWQLVQSADESWRECHLHARNLLGEHGYALRVVDLIAQRMTDGDDYRRQLTDPFMRDLAGDDGYVTVLTEIRARDLLYKGAWWSLVDELRRAGHLHDDGYAGLLDQLHARELLDTDGYRRRVGRAMPATDVGMPSQRVAETGPGGQPELFPTRRQRKLFE